MTTEPDLSQKFELGPYLSAALICETVIEDKSGTLSVIRIVDRVIRTSVGPNPPKIMEPFEYEFFIVVMLKTGENQGTFRVSVQAVKPTNEHLPPFTYTVNLESPGDRGANVVGRVRIPFDVDGLWWFDVSLNDCRVTRIPFRVIYLPQQLQGPH